MTSDLISTNLAGGDLYTARTVSFTAKRSKEIAASAESFCRLIYYPATMFLETDRTELMWAFFTPIVAASW